MAFRNVLCIILSGNRLIEAVKCFVLLVYVINLEFKRLELTTLYNGMILSILSINSHGFAFDFFKRPHTNRDMFFIYKPMINLLISRCGTPLPTFLNTNTFLCDLKDRFQMKRELLTGLVLLLHI